MLQPVGIFVELTARFSHQRFQLAHIHGRQLPDGPHAKLRQGRLCGSSHKQQRLYRQRPHKVLPVLRGNHRGCVWLFVIAAQLCKHLVKADPHGHRQSQLLFHSGADLIRHGPPVSAQQVEGPGHIQPALVHTERLHQIGVLLINGVDPVGIFPVQVVMGRQQHQSGAFFPRLPDGFRRDHAKFFRRFVLCQHNAPP
ncbi:hypothetical protein SDC9_170168 [bioreactor metagenome]|uniref:Uncharacterized protein n=1 Tax=bioreactor metagenome TaxID=1076179 RepID=A0A645GFQ0_9ZZZZ